MTVLSLNELISAQIYELSAISVQNFGVDPKPCSSVTFYANHPASLQNSI